MAQKTKTKGRSAGIHCEDMVECKHMMHPHDSAGAVYGLGVIGAAVYFIGQATTFWMGVLGFLKALVWPAFAVFGLLRFLGI